MKTFSFKRPLRSTRLSWLRKASRISALATCLITAAPSAWNFAAEPALPVANQQASSIDSLIEALGNKNPAVRKHAAEELTWLADEARPALPWLLEMLQDGDPLVRATAARAVWEIDRRADAAVPVLVHLLKSNDHGHRELAAYYLGPIAGEARAAAPVLRETLTDNDAGLRIHAAEALAQIEPAATDSVDTFIEALQSPKADIRSLAAMAFSSVDRMHAPKAVPALMAALADSDPGVRTAAELALPNFNLDVAHSTHPLREDFPQKTEAAHQPTEANTTPFANPTANPAPAVETASELEQAVRNLSHADPTMRRNALERISWLGEEAQSAAVDVSLCLNDPILEIRAYAAKTLWDVDKQSALAAVNTLSELVDSTQPGIRSLAAFYLGYIGPNASSALPSLKRAMANTEATEQLQIAEAVARIRPEDPDAVNVLIGGLTDAESGVRFQAAYALGEVAPVHAPRVVPALATAMADQSPEVRQAAEMAITNFPVPPAPETIQMEKPTIAPPTEATNVVLLDPEPVARAEVLAEVAGEYENAAAADAIPNSEAEPKRTDLGLGDDYRPIGSLNVSISPKRRSDEGQLLEIPTNYGAAWLEAQGVRFQPTGESRPWVVQPIQYAASGFCHRPLYFEEINLERYGHNYGCMQPFVSAAAFYGRVPLLPYMIAADCPTDCQYTLGHFRPGNCVPYYHHHLPWSTSGSLLQAGIVTGLFFAIY